MKKIEKRYQIGKYLIKYIKAKRLPITELLYLGYQLLFMSNNTISHVICLKNTI